MKTRKRLIVLAAVATAVVVLTVLALRGCFKSNAVPDVEDPQQPQPTAVVETVVVEKTVEVEKVVEVVVTATPEPTPTPTPDPLDEPLTRRDLVEELAKLELGQSPRVTETVGTASKGNALNWQWLDSGDCSLSPATMPSDMLSKDPLPSGQREYVNFRLCTAIEAGADQEALELLFQELKADAGHVGTQTLIGETQLELPTDQAWVVICRGELTEPTPSDTAFPLGEPTPADWKALYVPKVGSGVGRRTVHCPNPWAAAVE